MVDVLRAGSKQRLEHTATLNITMRATRGVAALLVAAGIMMATAPSKAQMSPVIDGTAGVFVDLSVLEDGGIARPSATSSRLTPSKGTVRLRMPSRKLPTSALHVDPRTFGKAIAKPKLTRPTAVAVKPMLAAPKAPMAKPITAAATPRPVAKPAPAPVKQRVAKAKPMPKGAPMPPAIKPAPKMTAAAPATLQPIGTKSRSTAEPAKIPAPMRAPKAVASKAAPPPPKVATLKKVGKAAPKPAPKPMAKPKPVKAAPTKKVTPPPPAKVKQKVAAAKPKAIVAPKAAPKPPAMPTAPVQKVEKPKPRPARTNNGVPKVSAPLPVPVAAAPKSAETASRTPASTAVVGDKLRIAFVPTDAKLPQNAKSELIALANKVKDTKTLRLQLMAYAGGDDLSSSKARRLSLSRALAVRSYLIEKGVRSTRIDVRALGNKTTDDPINRVDLNVIER